MGFISLHGLSALLISEQILNNNEDTAGRPSQMLTAARARWTLEQTHKDTNPSLIIPQHPHPNIICLARVNACVRVPHYTPTLAADADLMKIKGKEIAVRVLAYFVYNYYHLQ